MYPSVAAIFRSESVFQHQLALGQQSGDLRKDARLIGRVEMTPPPLWMQCFLYLKAEESGHILPDPAGDEPFRGQFGGIHDGRAGGEHVAQARLGGAEAVFGLFARRDVEE